MISFKEFHTERTGSWPGLLLRFLRTDTSKDLDDIYHSIALYVEAAVREAQHGHGPDRGLLSAREQTYFVQPGAEKPQHMFSNPRADVNDRLCAFLNLKPGTQVTKAHAEDFAFGRVFKRNNEAEMLRLVLSCFNEPDEGED